MNTTRPSGRRADMVVIGAGFAGLATTYHLARTSSGGKVLLLEKEGLPGTHSSGRNAAMVRQVTSEETISSMARVGSTFLRGDLTLEEVARPPGLFQPTGSLLLAGGEKTRQLETDMMNAVSGGLPIEGVDAGEARRRFPVLEATDFELGCSCPSDGVVDLEGLAAYYLQAARAAGADVLLATSAKGIRRTADGTFEVQAAGERIHTPVVVNAAGPWATDVGGMAGASAMPLNPRRRHIFVTRPSEKSCPDWPFLWDLTTEVYFRPEEGGLLMSPCDEADAGDRDSDAVNPGVEDILRSKLRRQFPSLAEEPIARSWSGIRTLTPDGRFLIGPDPSLPGFFWAAGLGGHGVTCSYTAGELAADLILHPEKDRGNPHSPSRLAS